jgi:MOSC domain-containing protein YiiM
MADIYPKINSINIALPAEITFSHGQTLYSGISKLPTTRKVYLNTLGFEGDGVADKKNHGGPDKAVCAYCLEHLPFWEKELDKELYPGAFGENLSLTGLLETAIHIGDQFKIGEAIIECSQPRQPCHRLNKKFDTSDMVHRMQNSGFSGYYFRVIQPGWVQSETNIVLTKKGPGNVSIDSANHLMHHDKLNYAKMEQIIEKTLLSERWKKTFKTRLEKKIPENVNSRLLGD